MNLLSFRVYYMCIIMATKKIIRENLLDTFSNSSLLLVYSYCHVHQYCLFIPFFLLLVDLTSPAAYNVALLCYCNSPYFLPSILIHFISFLLISPFFIIMEFWKKKSWEDRWQGGWGGNRVGAKKRRENKFALPLYWECNNKWKKIDIYRYHQQQWIEISFVG